MTTGNMQRVLRVQNTLSSLITAAIFQLLLVNTVAGAWFEEVTSAAGVTFTGPSYGASWGDVNGDGWPDLWVGNHAASPPDLFQNNRDGTFSQVFSPLPFNGDAHGSAWADFDNDGDQDLLMLLGAGSGTGMGANQFFINSGGLLQEQAQKYGLDYPLGRGRTPLWFDWNKDGNLDVFLANLARPDGAAPSALFSQTNGVFVDSFSQTGLSTSAADISFAQLMTIGTEHMSRLIISGVPFPDRVYDYGNTPFLDLDAASNLFPSVIWGARDVAIADFDGDLLEDLYIARAKDESEVVQTDPNIVTAWIQLTASEKGFTFSGATNIQVQLEPPYRLTPSEIFIGSQGFHPADLTFSLSSADPSVTGMFPHSPGVDSGVFIGYDHVSGQWQFLVSKDVWIGLSFIVTSSTSITGIQPIGFVNSDGAMADQLHRQNGIGFEDVSIASGVTIPTACESVVTADFDNDTDADLYLVCRGPTSNRPNILYENLGNGVFQPVANAGGAQGSMDGRGDSVAAADFDNDGFVDLFITNGRGDAPYNEGPSQLFHNVGNSNHWIELDLEGVISNRDAIGAEVQVTANGTTQTHLQAGGMHRYSQNHQRIHFGLAGNTLVESVSINWPSGISQTINNLPADEIVHVLEPSFPSLAGKPDYQPGLDEGLYLWKDTFDGPYHIEANGSGPSSVFSVELITDRPIAAVTTRSFESNDSLAWSGSYLDFEAHVGPWFDGLDVQLPPGTNAMIAVEQDGRPNPRQLHIGASGQPLTPSGWIIEADTLPPLPAFQGGQDLGLFIGRNAANGEVRARWNGDGPNHRAEIDFLFSQVPTIVTPVGIEANDVFIASDNAISIDSYVGSWWDGANIALQPGTRMGLAYTQDGLVQPHRVNPATRNLGLANAYRLPRAEPYGKPDYDPGAEAGLYLWQDKATGVWHLRGAAGGGGGRYTGEVVSDQPFTLVSAFSLESNDVLDTADPRRIVFDLGMWKQWEDGIDFQAAPGAQLTLNLTSGNPFGVPGKAVRIGEMKWPVDNLPLNLGGW
jgi:hypothetical protein